MVEYKKIIYMKEIGSIFSISNTNRNEESVQNSFFTEKNYSFWALCREALLAIAEKHDNSNKRILVPAYTCYSVIAPFQQLGWNVDYYNIKTNLRVDTYDLLEKCKNQKPELCLFHPYFGCGYGSDEVKAIEAVSALGITLIEDKTQCLFLNQGPDVFNYIVASIRKWFPVPDGAILFDKNDQISTEGLSTFEDYVSLQLEAMILREKYFDTSDGGFKEKSIKLNKTAELLSDGEINKHAISQYTSEQLRLLNIDGCKARRTENYKFLFENIGRASCIIGKINNSYGELVTAPLYFPVYLQDPVSVQREMAKHHIYLPLLWRTNAAFASGSADAKFIYEHIAVIPCDQRYDLNDMNKIIETLIRVS